MKEKEVNDFKEQIKNYIKKYSIVLKDNGFKITFNPTIKVKTGNLEEQNIELDVPNNEIIIQGNRAIKALKKDGTTIIHELIHAYNKQKFGEKILTRGFIKLHNEIMEKTTFNQEKLKEFKENSENLDETNSDEFWADLITINLIENKKEYLKRNIETLKKYKNNPYAFSQLTANIIGCVLGMENNDFVKKYPKTKNPDELFNKLKINKNLEEKILKLIS